MTNLKHAPAYDLQVFHRMDEMLRDEKFSQELDALRGARSGGDNGPGPPPSGAAAISAQGGASGMFHLLCRQIQQSIAVECANKSACWLTSAAASATLHTRAEQHHTHSCLQMACCG